jgi:DNA-binding transcriptional ArsR family regulator
VVFTAKPVIRKRVNHRDFPLSLVRAVEALSEKHRREIFMSLNDKPGLAYSELKAITGLDKGTLNHHLEKLIAGALIRNFRGESPANQYTSFYEISSIGKRLLTNLYSTFSASLITPLNSTDATSTTDIMNSGSWVVVSSPADAEPPVVELEAERVIIHG